MAKEDGVSVCIYVYTHTHTHTQTMEYYLAIKKNENLPFEAIWMDLEGIIAKWSVRRKKTNIVW